MTQDIYIGIDGGGTKSKIRVEDRAGKLLGQAFAGPANVRLSTEQAWQSIYHGLDDVLTPLAISLNDSQFRFHVGLGLAGSEVTSAAQAFIDNAHPFTTLKLVSDAHIACVSAHGLQPGAIIIIGTGVIGYQIAGAKSMRVSGWGFPHDDEGGGAWLGLEAIRVTLQWLDHRQEKSPLAEDVFNFFEQDKTHLVTWANAATSTDYARLAPIVINHSQQAEAVALRIMKKAAHAIDRVGVALEKQWQVDESTLPCCLFGGIAPFIQPLLGEALRSRLVTRKIDPCIGAILMVRENND